MKTLRILITSLVTLAAIGTMSANAQSLPVALPVLNKQLSGTQIGKLPLTIPAADWTVPVRVLTAEGLPVVNCPVVLYYGFYDVATGQKSIRSLTDAGGTAFFRLPGLRSISGETKRISLQAFTYGDNKYSMSTSLPVFVRR